MPDTGAHRGTAEPTTRNERIAGEADALADFCLAYSQGEWDNSLPGTEIRAQARRVKAALYGLPLARPVPQPPPRLLHGILIAALAVAIAGDLWAAAYHVLGAFATQMIGVGLGAALAIEIRYVVTHRHGRPDVSGRPRGEEYGP